MPSRKEAVEISISIEYSQEGVETSAPPKHMKSRDRMEKERMKKWIALSVIAAFASTSSAVMLSEGTRELVVIGLFDPDTEFDSQLDIGIAYGQFVQDLVELGVGATLSDNDVLETWSVFAFAEYNWDMGTELVPYVGVTISYANAEIDFGDGFDADDDAFGVGGSLGVKYFISENIAISGALNYEWASEDIFFEDDGVEDTNFDVDLAMRFFF